MSKTKIVTAFPYQVKVVEHQWITLKDGTRLAARMWLPIVPENVQLPAILEYIPYRKTDGTRARDEPMHGYFSGHGYNVIRVDIRGSGESDGLLKGEYLAQEQDDALEVIEWISQQDWCDGKVGMMGKSWGGFNALQVAARQPEALKAIISVGYTDDRYNGDIHYKGGCLLNDNFWWGAIMLAYQARPIDPKIVGSGWRDDWLKRLDAMPLWMGDWLEHQTRDEFWQHGSVCEDYSQIKVPVMAVDGWQDAYTNTIFSLLEGLSVPKKGFIGPWAHVYPQDGTPAPAIGFLQEAVKWWDHWLKDEQNDVLADPMVQVWLEDSIKPSAIKLESPGRWVGIEDWPSKAVDDRTYFINEEKLVREQSETQAAIKLQTPLNHGLFAGEHMGAGVLGETASDQRMDDGLARVYETHPLDAPLEIVGYPVFEIELASDKTNGMLFAQLSDVDEEGAVTRVSYGVINLSHLQGHDQVVPLEPNETVTASIKLDCCGHHFPKGHRIRLSLATSFWPMFWPMPEEATFTLALETAKLTLPIFNGDDASGPIMSPETASLTPTTFLKEGRVDRSLNYDVLTDTWTCITDGVGGVFGEGVYCFDDVDVTVEHNLLKEQRLTNGDPLSAKHKITQKMKIGRDGWLIDADIIVEMHGDATHFYLSGNMIVKENDVLVFTKEYDETIKRNGL